MAGQEKHLSQKDIETICQLILANKAEQIANPLLKHIFSCDECLIEIQESIQDLRAMELTQEYLVEKEEIDALQEEKAQEEIRQANLSRAEKKEHTSAKGTFQFVLRKLHMGFQILQSNWSQYISLPMPLFRSAQAQEPGQGTIKLLTFYKKYPIKITIEEDSNSGWWIRIYGIPSIIQLISIYRNQKNQKTLLIEASTGTTKHDIYLSKAQMYDNSSKEPTTIYIYANSNEKLGEFNIADYC